MARLDYYKLNPELINKMSAIGKQLEADGVDAKLRVLLELRVSQINGCIYCVDLHSKQLRAKGETAQRLDTLVVWQESPFFDDKERAALAWAETLTLISECRAPDEIFDELKAHFSDKEIVDLTLVITTINAWNRISIGFGNLPHVAREKK